MLLSGVRDEHRCQLQTHNVRMFPSTPDAIEYARSHLRRIGTLPR